MSLPTYDKNKRKKSYQQLPKGAYVIKIKASKEEKNKNSDGTHLRIAFDIAEGEYAGFYQNQYDSGSNEDKKWPADATYNLNIPTDSSESWVWDNWNTFFADLEDSNNGFVFAGDPKTLAGKIIGGKFHIRQSEWKGTVYDHTQLKWTCVAADVRNGKAGKLPNDRLINGTNATRSGSATQQTDENGFLEVPEGMDAELPF